jgi:hypothetical protein
MTEQAKAFTKAMYHLRTAKEYLEVFKIEADKANVHNVRGWINKLNFIENDASSIMTAESRDHFRKEIKQGDILFHSNISTLLLHLDDKQRLLVEDLVNAMIKGESIIPVKEPAY